MTRERVAFLCLLGGTCSSLCVCVCALKHTLCRLDDTVDICSHKIYYTDLTVSWRQPLLNWYIFS